MLAFLDDATGRGDDNFRGEVLGQLFGDIHLVCESGFTECAVQNCREWWRQTMATVVEKAVSGMWG